MVYITSQQYDIRMYVHNNQVCIGTYVGIFPCHVFDPIRPFTVIAIYFISQLYSILLPCCSYSMASYTVEAQLYMQLFVCICMYIHNYVCVCVCVYVKCRGWCHMGRSYIYYQENTVFLNQYRIVAYIQLLVVRWVVQINVMLGIKVCTWVHIGLDHLAP